MLNYSSVAVSQVLPEGSGLSIIDRLKEVTQNLESSKAEERDMLELAQISRELPLSDDQDSADANHAWSDGNRYGRIIEQLCRQLHNAQASNFDSIPALRAKSNLISLQGDEYTFNCLVALLNLVTHQAPLLNSRELNILEALFAVSQTLNKNVRASTYRICCDSLLTTRMHQIRTGAECVTLGVISATEPLYAASCIRICLDNLQIARPFSDSPPEESETRNWTFAMGLKAMGALFSLLPSEVLEEEIVRSRDLIKQVRALLHFHLSVI